MDDLAKMKAKIEKLDSWIAWLECRADSLAGKLGPYWAERRDTQNRIARTHATVDDDDGQPMVVGWRRANRANMFARLDKLAEVYGPLSQEFANVKRMVKAAIRERSKLIELIEREERKQQNKIELEERKQQNKIQLEML